MAIYARLENGTYAEVTGVYKTDGTEITEIFQGDRLVYSATNEIYGTLPLYYSGGGFELIDYVIYGDTIQDGTPSAEDPVDAVGCGVRTRNLFDKTQPTTVTNKYLLSNGEESSNASGWAVSAYIPVSGDYVTLSSVGGNLPSICAYDSNKQFVRGINYGSNNRTTIDISDCSFVRFSYVPTVQRDNAMLNLGSEALPYEPYGYKLPPTVNGTEYPIYLGQVETTRRIKKLVLTGEEYWQLWNGNYYSSVIDRKGAISTILCTHFINASGGITYSIDSSSGLKIASAAVPFVTSVADLKTWLAAQYANGTPVTVWYVLATPETAVVNEPLMKIGDYADTVSFAQAGVTIPTVNGANVLDMASPVKPSEVYIKGKGIKELQNS